MADISIPTELLSQQSLLNVLLIMVVPGLWGLWLNERNKRDTENRDATTSIADQRVLNERSVARIELITYQRDESIKNFDKCEKSLERCRYPQQQQDAR